MNASRSGRGGRLAKAGFERSLPVRQQVDQQYRGDDGLNDLQHYPVLDFVGCGKHEPGESPQYVGKSMGKGRDPDAPRPEIEPRHGYYDQDVVNRGHDERTEERMLRIFVHHVVDRRVPEAPDKPQQKEAANDAELPNQAVLGVTSPPKFLPEGQRQGDNEVNEHILQKFGRMNDEATCRRGSWRGRDVAEAQR